MGEKHEENGAPRESPLVQLAHHSGHGLTIALSTGLFLLAGWWVDGKLGTRPLFSIAGALLGAAAGFYSLLQHVLFMPRQKEREREERMRAVEEQESMDEDRRNQEGGRGPGGRSG